MSPEMGDQSNQGATEDKSLHVQLRLSGAPVEVKVAILRSQLVHAIQLDLLQLRIHEALVVLQPPVSSSPQITLPADNANDAG